jgi:phospholipid transport system substrate-binding protein
VVRCLAGWQSVALKILAFVILAAVMAFPLQTAFAQGANPAEMFVQQNVDRGYRILNDQALSREQRREQFRNFLLSLTDLHRIGMFTLGQYARGATPADLQAFDKAFTDYAVAVYESRLVKYSGQTLKVTGSIPRASDDVIVNAVVANARASSGQEPIRVAFRVRKTADGRPIITDMEAEGIWLALTERSDFIAYLQQHGGSISALTDHLKSQAEQTSMESRRQDLG